MLDMDEYLLQINNKTMGRADFKPDLFDRIIQQKGFRVKWEQGMFCSCISEEAGQPSYNCPVCGGKGYIYVKPLETRVVVSSISGRKEQEKAGLEEKGSLYMTPLSLDNVGFRDRVTFLDFSMKFSEILIVKEGKSRTRYPLLSVIYAHTLGIEYKEGIDFIYELETREVTWINPVIQEGDKISILYLNKPVYIAMNPIHELRGTYIMTNGKGEDYFVNLPKQYMIKREDFVDVASLYT